MRNPVRLVRLLLALGKLTRDLGRLGRVFEINDHLVALRTPTEEAAVIADFRRTPSGHAALRDRTRLGLLNLSELAAFPPETLGSAYARFMRSHGLAADALPSREASSEIEYIIAHYYETHDLWHVVTGFDTDPAGELGVQAVLLAQSHSYLPLLLMAAILTNTALFAYEDRIARLDALVRGWTLGRSAESLVGIDWRPHLSRPLAEVRRDLALVAA
jgi:ubiquinone biosynthesis protein Coq4